VNTFLTNKNTDSNYISQPFLWFLFFLTVFLTLIPFFKVGLTNCDDVEFYLHGLIGETARKAYAEGAGRFYFLITKPIYHVAYLVDNFYFTKIIQYGFVLLSFVLFAVVVKKIVKQTTFALLVFLLLFVFLTVTPNYFIPIIALPVYFTLSFSIFLLSLLALIKYYEVKKDKYLIFSIILIAIALLFYENYLTFILFVLIFIFAKNVSEQGKKIFKSKTVYKEIIPFVAICIAYVAVYYLYRWYVQTENGFYYGTTIAKKFNFDHFFQFIWNPNKAAFPTFVYHKLQGCINANSLLATGHQHNFWYLIKNSQAISLVNALIQCFLFCFLFGKMKPTISWKKIGIGVLTVFILMFAVNFLMAISEKYNALYYNMDGYVTTYYLYFCVTLFIALLAYACFKLGYQNKYIRTAVVAVFAFLIFCISIIIGYSNDHLSRDWQHAHSGHLMMEKLIEKDAFDAISDNAIIYMDNYNQSVSKLGNNLYSSHSYFWTSYIHIKTHRLFNIHTNFENFKNDVQADPQRDIYYITKYEAQKSSDILLVLSKVNSNSIDFENEETTFANEAEVYYYSANKDFIFQFVIPQCSDESTIMINNEIQKASSGINAIRIENMNKKKAITTFTLKSDDAFLVKNFAISNIGGIDEKTVYLYNY